MTVPWEIGTRKSGKMNYEAMHNNLLIFDDCMNKFGIPHIFIFGGLLGLIRENRLLPFDDDVEFACFSKDHRKMKYVIEELTAQGFYIPDKNECPMHDHFFIRDKEKIEIWWFDKIGNEYVYDNGIRYHQDFFDQSTEIEFLGRQWKVPRKPKEFLKITYGESWIIPDPKGRYILGRERYM